METLREYQRACVEAIAAAKARGVGKMLAVMATGTGKGWVMGRLPKILGAQRTLALAHRLELVDQLAGHLQNANPDATVSIEQADRHEAGPSSDIVVGCIPTLARDWRRHKFAAWRPDLLLVDESHHMGAKSWEKVVAEMGGGTTATLVGWTATPMRNDGKALANIFDELVFALTGLRHLGESVVSILHRASAGASSLGLHVPAHFLTHRSAAFHGGSAVVPHPST